MQRSGTAPRSRPLTELGSNGPAARRKPLGLATADPNAPRESAGKPSEVPTLALTRAASLRDEAAHPLRRGSSGLQALPRRSSSPPLPRRSSSSDITGRPAPHTARGPSPSAQPTRPRRTDLLVLDGVDTIFEHIKASEAKHLPLKDYMKSVQSELNAEMRGICTDWVIECAARFKMQDPTLHLAANILDRFLSQKAIRRERMQLVSMVCLIIAAKYEEVYPPRVKDYIHISANHFTQADLLRYEHYVLHALNYTLTVPTVHCFISSYLTQLNANGNVSPEPVSAKKLRDASLFLAETAMLSLELYLRELPSLLGAACVHAAHVMLRMEPQRPAHCQWPQGQVAALAADVLQQARSVRDGGKLTATVKRFRDPARNSVAALLQ